LRLRKTANADGGRSEKNEKGIAIVEKAAEDEMDTTGAGQPGNWMSKVGISITNFGKWNPFFKVPTLGRTTSVCWKLAKFYESGAIISVAYVNPDNYRTNIAAGSQFLYSLLFMILLSNITTTVYMLNSTATSLSQGCESHGTTLP
jgi:hypothetical protein